MADYRDSSDHFKSKGRLIWLDGVSTSKVTPARIDWPVGTVRIRMKLEQTQTIQRRKRTPHCEFDERTTPPLLAFLLNQHQAPPLASPRIMN